MARSKEMGYRDVAKYLRDLAEQGQPGDKMPSIQELIGRLKVAQLTVTRAYRMLVDEGLVIAQRPVGHFIAPPNETIWLMTDTRSPRRVSPTSPPERNWDVVVRTVRDEDLGRASVRTMLWLEPHDQLIVARDTVQFLDGAPVMQSNAYLPYELAKDTRLMEDLPIFLGAFLKELAGTPKGQWLNPLGGYADHVSPRMATDRERGWLPPGPVLEVVRHYLAGPEEICVAVERMVFPPGEFVWANSRP